MLKVIVSRRQGEVEIVEANDRVIGLILAQAVANEFIVSTQIVVALSK
jgi:hypothetical protein